MKEMNSLEQSDDFLRHRIRELFQKLLLRDRARIASQLKRIEFLDRNGLEELCRYLENLSAHALTRFAARLNSETDPALPVSARAADIAEAMKKHPVVIVCGATGSGKTTQLPKIALSIGLGRYGRIGCTQPRRIAASSLARRLAAETGCECGREVGYKVRFDDHTERNTVIKFMTDGILLAETRNDPRLLEYECLILDEVHERTLNIDFLLGYVKRLLEKRRDLHLVISSATLEADRISAFFSGAPVIEVEGRMYPIEDCYLPPEEDEELPESVARGVDFLTSLDARGDILVFLPGEREIRDCAERLEGRQLPHTQLLPLFGRLSAGEQQKVFSPGSQRRIVLATNVAETSITIPGIRFVIDSGLVRLSRYNPRSRIQELRIESVSKASARQRRGRCGRVQNGVCVHLYSEEQYGDYADFTPPEIQRSSLAGVLLQMEALRLGPVEDFPLMDPPSPALVREGRQMLEDLLAMDASGHLTHDGRKMAEIPLDPHLARMLMSALHYKVLPEILVIAAWLSIPDPRERPMDAAAAADQAHRQFSCPESDFISILMLHLALEELLSKRNSHQALRLFARKNYYNYRRLREWRNLIDDLKQICKENQWNCEGRINPEHLSADAVHKTLMCALPRQLGCRQPETGLYSDMKGKKFSIFPGSALAGLKKNPPWIMSFVLVETSRVFARTNAVVQPGWLEETAPHICSRTYDLIHWDADSGFVYAREKVMAGQLLIHPGRRCHYARIRPDEARRVFIREGLASGLARLPGSWLDGFNDLLRSIRQLEIKMRRPDAILNLAAVIRHFERVLPPEIHSVQALKEDWWKKRCDYSPEPDDIVLVPLEELHEEDYPDYLTFSGMRFRLKYVFDPGEENDGITLLARQELLNLIDPCLPDYMVPGWLSEKVGFMLRSMNKSLRRQFMPLDEVQDAFMETYRNGGIFTGRDLAESLCGFLRDFRGDAPDPELFREMELPEYLVMKLAVEDAEGHVRIHRKFPGGTRNRSKLSHALPAVRQFHCISPDAWPGNGSLPLTMTFSAENPVPAYPALSLEGDRIAREIFLDENEARQAHERALIRLWKLSLPQILKPLRNSLKPSPQMELEYFLHYSDWKEDVIELAVRSALGGDLWTIRSAEDFSERMEISRDLVAEKVTERFTALQQMTPLLLEVRRLQGRLREGAAAERDSEAELKLYFRSGFFRTPELFDRTARYLKALEIRLRRASDSPEKDRLKGAWLESFIRKFRIAEEAVKGVENSSGLLDFLLLLEEARIAVYAPEIRPLVKCSEKILAQAWQDLKLK